MSTPDQDYPRHPGTTSKSVREEHIEKEFIDRLLGLKYEYRPDIRDRAALEQNFREKFQQLNRVNLTDNEFLKELGLPLLP